MEIGLSRALHVRDERLSARPDACRLLYVSDIHLRNGRSAALSRQVLDAAERCRPDAVLLGGDLVDRRSELSMGIIALDTLHVIRRSRPLPRPRSREVALFLDFAGCIDAAWDRKGLCAEQCRAVRQRLDQVGLGACITDYLARLQQIERWRPSIGGDHRRFAEVREYREAVARTLATADGAHATDQAMFPLRLALTAATKLVIWVADPRHQHAQQLMGVKFGS